MTRGLLWSVILVGCGGPVESGETTSLEELLDPASCAECHPDHHREWSGSMHAYAAEDPVFLAMNRRGQRETNGELGTFCIDCHAPVAVRLGLTTDGLNLDELPAWSKGVTCYYCHQVTEVQGQSNNPLVLAWDKVMRGGIVDPVDNTFHKGRYSTLHDRAQLESSDMCGSCHDIVNPLGTHIERTSLEWRESLYSLDSVFKLTCSECHMRGRDGVAADYPGVKVRRVKDHSMPGVDLAITDFPEREAQRELVQTELDRTVEATVCVADVQEQRLVQVWLENIGAGHSFPSGAAADRRVWVEVIAYQGDEEVWSSGVVEEGQPVTELDDPNLWLFRDTLLDENGQETHDFWEAVDYRTNLLRAPVFRDFCANGLPRFDEFVEAKIYNLGDLTFDRVRTRVRVRAMGLDVLDDLISTGDLDPKYRDEIVTMDLAPTVLEWTPEVAVERGDFYCFPDRQARNPCAR